MRRPAPRPLHLALDAVVEAAAPAGLLPRVQAAWDASAGPAVAAQAEPVAERGGVVTVACASAVWAHELELLRPELTSRLNGQLGASEAAPAVHGLRFVTRS